MPAAYRPREQSVLQLRPEGSAGRTLIACKVGGHTLFSLRPSTDWMRPTHVMKGNPFTQSPLIEMLISSKSIQCRIILALISRHHNPAKWAHKIIITLCLGILRTEREQFGWGRSWEGHGEGWSCKGSRRSLSGSVVTTRAEPRAACDGKPREASGEGGELI